ncbi:MAG: putative porin [Terrimicrobiaceae bacterium]
MSRFLIALTTTTLIFISAGYLSAQQNQSGKSRMIFDQSSAAPTPNPAATTPVNLPAWEAPALLEEPLSGESANLLAQAGTASRSGKSDVSDLSDTSGTQASTPPSPGQDIAESARTELPPGPGPAPQPVVEDVVTASEAIDLAPQGSALDGGPLPGGGPSLPPSQSVTINLINKLVQRGILTKEDAAGMIAQAEAEAEVARSQTQADMFAVAQIAAQQAAAEQIAIDQALGAPSEEDITVTYIPEPVRAQIKEDIKMELMDEVGRKPFRDLSVLPGWVTRLNPYGDLRVRFEGDLFPYNNDSSGAFPDFDAINTGSPFDVTGNQFAPQYNTDQDRYRVRLRARLGFNIDMADGFTMGFRLATGNDNSPVSTNQTLGAPNGNFNKYAVWLDRAFLQWNLWNEPQRNLQVSVGRFANPFFSTNLIWDDDLQFDGIAGSIKYEVLDGFRPFLTGGAFPVYNTAFNFPENLPSKYESYDKWLFGGQIGFDWEFANKWNLKVGTAYYHFYQIEGKLSSPFVPLTDEDAGDTDNSRPLFAQKGNTYFPIRNIIPDASNDFGAINQWQYYGLATKFHELAVTARLDYNGFEPIQISLIGEFVTNLAWNKDDINAIAVNNRGEIDPNDIDDILGQYEGSPYAYLVRLQVGHPEYLKRWDWSAHFEYRWIGSDSVVDGFNDSDFGLGGTNMQGFTVAGFVALAPNIWIGARWMGSDSIAGPQFNVNIFQIDLNGKF